MYVTLATAQSHVQRFLCIKPHVKAFIWFTIEKSNYCVCNIIVSSLANVSSKEKPFCNDLSRVQGEIGDLPIEKEDQLCCVIIYVLSAEKKSLFEIELARSVRK